MVKINKMYVYPYFLVSESHLQKLESMDIQKCKLIGIEMHVELKNTYKHPRGMEDLFLKREEHLGMES